MIPKNLLCRIIDSALFKDTSVIGIITIFNHRSCTGNILTVIRPDGIIQESNLYDAEGNLIHTHDGTGKGVDIEYDIGGRRTKIMTKGKASQQYVYDAPGNITGITDGAGNHTDTRLDVSL